MVKGNEKGQAMLEYVLLLSILAVLMLVVMRGVRGMGLSARLVDWISGPYKSAYAYGHPKAKGFDDGGPKFHPRSDEAGENNFRLFINPGN